MKINACPLPTSALLRKYTCTGNYTDCFTVDLDHRVSHEQFVVAFYTTSLFKLERWILSWAVNRPSTDAEALELGQGRRDQFAAWDVEARCENQLLLCDLYGRTRSWLMTSCDSEDSGGTRLHFGSAVVSRGAPTTGSLPSGWGFRALLDFHKLYSRLLLSAACSKLHPSDRSS